MNDRIEKTLQKYSKKEIVKGTYINGGPTIGKALTRNQAMGGGLTTTNQQSNNNNNSVNSIS